MKIGFISGHACIRAQKMALGLIQNNQDIYFISTTTPSFYTYFKSCQKYETMAQIKEAIRILDPVIDLWHVHNEPSYYVSLCKELSKKPVVLDIHDSNLARISPSQYDEMKEKGEQVLRISAEERVNFQCADALVYPSQSFADIIREEFSLKQPEIILPSFVPECHYNYNATEWVGGIVYEGRVDLPEESNKPGKQGYNYTDYTEFMNLCHEGGVDFHLYATRADKPFLKHYKDAIIHPSQRFERLIGLLSGHDWGLVGNSMETDEWKVAFPNKLFEYIAAGTPIVSWNAKECSKFIKKHKIGITIKSIDELKDKWSQHRECRANIIKLRSQFAMENNQEPLLRLYEDLLT